jgi:glycosyltransferase involved in cell wall biosynthesis
MKIKKKILMLFQSILLRLSYYLIASVNKWFKNNKKNIILGTDEECGILKSLSIVFDNAFSVCFSADRFFDHNYDYQLSNRFLKLVLGPILLGYLMNLSDIFLFTWTTGYCHDREIDFKFLKKKNKKIITLFLGSDIRSLKKYQAFFDRLEQDCFISYLSIYNKSFSSDSFENQRLLLAKQADRYADVIFNDEIDQPSYIEKRTHAYPYFVDLSRYSDSNYNSDLSIIKIVHAPSNPLVKGTPLVRAAIKKLKEEGYNFEYIELVNVSNDQVLKTLASSHILLNQFYGTLPGVLGLEGLCTYNAVLMSADPQINTNLPEEASESWFATQYWEIYDNLKLLLDNPQLIKKYALAGRRFVENHYTYEKAGNFFKKVLNSEGIFLT